MTQKKRKYEESPSPPLLASLFLLSHTPNNTPNAKPTEGEKKGRKEKQGRIEGWGTGAIERRRRTKKKRTKNKGERGEKPKTEKRKAKFALHPKYVLYSTYIPKIR